VAARGRTAAVRVKPASNVFLHSGTSLHSIGRHQTLGIGRSDAGLWQNLLNNMAHMHLSLSQRPLTAMHV
jgi:hypothetical protein